MLVVVVRTLSLLFISLFVFLKSVVMFTVRMPQSSTIETAQVFFLDVMLDGNEVDSCAHLVPVLFHPLENEASCELSCFPFLKTPPQL